MLSSSESSQNDNLAKREAEAFVLGLPPYDKKILHKSHIKKIFLYHWACKKKGKSPRTPNTETHGEENTHAQKSMM